MIMARKRFKTLIPLIQWLRRKRVENYAFKVARKEARRFKKDMEKRNKTSFFRQYKFELCVFALMFSIFIAACLATHLLTKWSI